MKVVLDTNVLVSALPKRYSVPARILRAVWDGTLQPLLSQLLREELAAVLEYRKIKSGLRPSPLTRVCSWNCCPSL